MLRSINELKGFDVVATSGEIGDVKQFYFDDERWVVRHIVVNTGDWVMEHNVLISPFAVTRIDYDNRNLYVALTKEQVASSPDIDTHKPVSQQMEAMYSDYYSYPYYWPSPLLWGIGARPDLSVPLTPATLRLAGSAAAMKRVIPPEVHLHSIREVANYHISAIDGLIGYGNDFIVDDQTWAIRYLVIDTRNWLLGKQVIIDPRWVTSIDWAQGQIHVNLSRDAIRQSPEYDSAKLHLYEDETLLHLQYRHPDYSPDIRNEK